MAENHNTKLLIHYILKELEKINDELGVLAERIARLEAQQSTTHMIIKYVVVPLLGIVAGLVGLKLFLP
ncbi:MAG: hypothetical protein DRJ40_11540 [Thermoprotei archaeon]|nr:MAG: hypothetical protein DRJ40_11540 [Thermoprotei archaeon]